MTIPYFEIPKPPETISSTNVIARLIDGLGFRYRWATENLREDDLKFRPSELSMNMIELLGHIYSLAYQTNKVLGGTIKREDFITIYKLSESKNEIVKSYMTIRFATIDLYLDLSNRLKKMDEQELLKFNSKFREKEYPFWYLLNGQIADALTHVGQINSWRRISGNPIPDGVNVFFGKKVESK